jgi:histidinol-phosphate aminotransferase
VSALADTPAIEPVPPPLAPGDDLILDRNESPILWAGLRTVRIDGEALRRYPDPTPLREAWANDLGLASEQALITNGGDEAIELILRNLVPRAGRIAVATPTFSSFEVTSRTFGQTLLRVPYEPDGAYPTERMLEALERERPDAVICIDPNNPTGTPLPEGLIERIRAAAPDALIILDRAYADFSGARDDAALVARDANLAIIRSLSKCPGLAGLRIGALIGDPALLTRAATGRQPYTVNAAAIQLGLAAIADAPGRALCIEEVGRSREILLAGLADLGIRTIAGPTNFVLALLGDDARWICRQCRARGLRLRDFSACPDFPGSVRITVGDDEQTRRALDILGAVMRRRPLLFDVDGTLIDVERSYIACIRRSVEALAGRAADDALIDAAKADARFNDDYDATREVLRRMGVEADLDRVIAAFDACYRGDSETEGLRETETLRIATERLASLGRRFTLGIVTGRPRADLEWALDRFGWRDLFPVAIAADDGAPSQRKPDPWPIAEALRRLGDAVDPELARYIGDGPADRAAAEAAGVRFIGTGPLAAHPLANDPSLADTLDPLGDLP